MKKFVAVLTVALLALCSVFAATSTRWAPYGRMFQSGEYTLKGTVRQYTSGYETDSSGVTLAQHSGMTYMSYSGGESYTVIIRDGSCYMIEDSSKSILMLTGDSMDDETPYYPATLDVISSGNGTLNGKSLYYEKASVDGEVNTFWYSGNTLYAIESEETESGIVMKSIMFIDSFVSGAPASLFEIPSGYEVTDLSSMGDWFSFDDSYDYDSYDWGDWLDFEDEEHYAALGKALGLNNAQAQKFADAMDALSYVDWYNLEDYYDEDTDSYKLPSGGLQSVLYNLTDEEFRLLRTLVSGFAR